MESLETGLFLSRVGVLTQTCDLANGKVTEVVVAAMYEADWLVEQKILTAKDVRGPIRSGRVFGWYYIPKSDEFQLPESIVDLRRLHTVRLDILDALRLNGKRRARILPLYREHMAKHFADTYSRIGLPEPYPTE